MKAEASGLITSHWGLPPKTVVLEMKFLTRAFWGTESNQSMKYCLLCTYSFKKVTYLTFVLFPVFCIWLISSINPIFLENYLFSHVIDCSHSLTISSFELCTWLYSWRLYFPASFAMSCGMCLSLDGRREWKWCALLPLLVYKTLTMHSTVLPHFPTI